MVARIDVDFTKAPHRLSPEFVEALREALCQLGVAHEQGREPPLLHERMIERKDDGVVVDDVEWMPELAGVANAGDLAKVVPVDRQELHQAGPHCWYEKPKTIRCSTPCSAAFFAMRRRMGNPSLTAVSIAIRSPASMSDRIRFLAAANGTRCRRIWPSTPSASRGKAGGRAPETAGRQRSRSVEVASAAKRSDRSRAISMIRLTTASVGSAANILRPCRLDLHQAEAGQLLHRQVDLRPRHVCPSGTSSPASATPQSINAISAFRS